MKGLRFCLAMVLAVVLLVSASDKFAAADLLVTSDQLVNLSASTTTDTGIINSFQQVLPNGSTITFAIPAGKVFVVCRVQCGAINVPGNPLGLKLILENKSTLKAYLKHGLDNVYFDVGTNTTGGVIKGENFYPGFPISKPFRARLADGADNQLAGKLGVRIFGYLADIPAP